MGAEIEDGKWKAYIYQQATALAKKKKEEGVPPTKVTGPIKLFIKRKMMDKVDCLMKKLKVVPPTIGETPPTTQLPPSPRHRIGKGLMMAKGPIIEKRSPFSMKICNTPLANCHPSSRTTTIST